MQEVRHPAIVSLLAHKLVDTVGAPNQEAPEEEAEKQQELWLMLEYCDKGSLEVPASLQTPAVVTITVL